MIVITIIAILATILIVQWIGARKAAYDSETLTVARNCVLAAQVYYASEGELSYEDMDLDALEAIEPSLGETGVTLEEPVVAVDGQSFTMEVGPNDPGTHIYDVTEAGVERQVPAP